MVIRLLSIADVARSLAIGLRHKRRTLTYFFAALLFERYIRHLRYEDQLLERPTKCLCSPSGNQDKPNGSGTTPTDDRVPDAILF